MFPAAKYAPAVLRDKIDDEAHRVHLARVKASRTRLYETASALFADAVRQTLDAPTLVMPLRVNVSLGLPPTFRGFDVKAQLNQVRGAAERVCNELSALGYVVARTWDDVEAFEFEGGYQCAWDTAAATGRVGRARTAEECRLPTRKEPLTRYQQGDWTCVQFKISLKPY